MVADTSQFHDDGESTLGPHIAAWSLGCPAFMNIRMKAKFYSGFKKDRTYDPNLPIIPGCFKADMRQKLNDKKDSMDNKKLTTLAKTLLKGCPTNPPVILKMKLRHGDFMSMHGASMQKYYEVSVLQPVFLVGLELINLSTRSSLQTNFALV